MTKRSIAAEPIWMEASLPTFAPLDRDIDVDVVVVGGGLTGVTTAYLLRSEGLRVALIERDRVAAADTGHTTAHLTYVTDYRLSELVEHFGEEAAKAFWNAGAAAIDQIERIIAETGAECDFRRVPGYLHEPVSIAGAKARGKELESLKKDAALARSLGFDAEFVAEIPLIERAGVHFSNQAKFHPRKYLKALLRAIPGNGSYVFEHTAFESVEDEPFAVIANGKRIRCDYLVLATHNPLMGRKNAFGAALFQTKLSLYTSYVLGARLPLGSVPEALFWDTRDPYDYLRVDTHADHQYVIFGGEDVKTGQEEDIHQLYGRLENRLHHYLPNAQITHRWLGQVVETDDGLPFIGENTERQFIATGFCGNGFTLGTVSAVMARDRLMNRQNAWVDLFRVDRKPFHGGIWRYVSENVDFPKFFVRDRFAKAEGDLNDVPAGQGRIITLDGDKVAAYRSEQGEVLLCSPVCTHMKCLVGWNDADKTWDCPCHGSRFHPDGRVHSGPAEEPLEVIAADAARNRPAEADKDQHRHV
jgi:glycine/D-amino acid oxidase-like deaminating enzyme/nitrite reductase/ring-hydroxylating ferredoxin subunit